MLVEIFEKSAYLHNEAFESNLRSKYAVYEVEQSESTLGSMLFEHDKFIVIDSENNVKSLENLKPADLISVSFYKIISEVYIQDIQQSVFDENIEFLKSFVNYIINRDGHLAIFKLYNLSYDAKNTNGSNYILDSKMTNVIYGFSNGFVFEFNRNRVFVCPGTPLTIMQNIIAKKKTEMSKEWEHLVDLLKTRKDKPLETMMSELRKTKEDFAKIEANLEAFKDAFFHYTQE